ncbi:MAG TPA: RIP metalloprotease RseP [Candidatus Acidoferrales bacterium]|nr:RIP metalloprotease RseP [Candidatus Acidoferrales bacterium]
MNNFLISIASIIIVLGVMIVVHEWGHFIVARACRVRVDVFSVGMGPRIWGYRRGPTDYRLSALPIGGYVRMAGENPTDQRTGAPDEFLSKPRWQRALIVLAGPVMNVFMAVVIAVGMMMAGKTQPAFLRNPPQVAGVLKGSAAAQAGLREADLLVKVNGKAVRTWDDVVWQTIFIAPGARMPIEFSRAGRLQTVVVQTSPDADMTELVGYPIQKVSVASVTAGFPAKKAGLEAGDLLVSANGRTVDSQLKFNSIISGSGGKPVDLVVERAGRQLALRLNPVLYDPGDGGGRRWMIGTFTEYRSTVKAHRLGDAVRGGLRYNVMLTSQIVNVLFKLAEHKASVKTLTGPIGVAKQSGEAAREGLLAFLNVMAVVSLNLGILNLLPIPILDGGHLLLLGVEGTIRRDLSLAVKERALQVGLVFLLLLFVIVMYNDILKVLPIR